MPDNDHVPRGIVGPWRTPWRMTHEGFSSTAQVGDQITKATAAALRETDGLPGLSEVIYAYRYAAIYHDYVALDAACRRFLDLNGRKPLALTMLREADSTLATDSAGLAHDTDEHACASIAERGLRRWVDERLWGRGHDRLLETFGDHDAARRFELEATAAASLGELAGRLLANPSAVGLRAPDRKVRARETSSLLHEVLDA